MAVKFNPFTGNFDFDSGGPGSVTAASVSYNNVTSGLTSTNVQTAIDEVEGRLDTTESDISNHLSDATDAHDASAISNIPSGNLAATDVQGALNELQSDVDSRATATALSDHITDAVDAHDASAISNVPSGNLSANDVQGALNELQTELDGAANKTLSNLTSPTAINQHLLPGVHNDRTLGQNGTAWKQINVGPAGIEGQNSGGAVTLQLTASSTTPSGSGAGASLVSPSSTGGNLTVFSTNTGGLTGSLFLETGNSSGADSGDINIQTGTASGTRGKVILNGRIIDATSKNISNVADPLLSQDAATKIYVDNLLDGRSWKDSVRVSPTTNINLASVSDPNPMDGISISAGDRVLLKAQSAGAENGIYTAVDETDPTTWVRSLDANTALEVTGVAVYVQEGTVNGTKQFAQTAVNITLDTTPLVWVQSSANNLLGHDMITVSGGQISVDLASDSGMESTNPGNSAGQLRNKLHGTTLTRSSSGMKITDGVTLIDTGANASIDTETRTLKDSTGSTIFTYSTAGTLTAVASLEPTTSNTRNLGSTSNRWMNLYTSSIKDSGDVTVMDVTGRNLNDTAGGARIKFGNTAKILLNNHTVPDGASFDLGEQTQDWRRLYVGELRTLTSSAILDLNNKLINTSGGTNIIDIDNSLLKTGATSKLGWSGANVDVFTRKIVNVVDPTADQDVATKKYVDDSIPAVGATTALDNLTSPTAINQDLIFAKTTPILKSADSSSTATEALLLSSGGVSTVTSNSGDVTLTSGDQTVTGIGQTGIVTITTGNRTATSSTGKSGNLVLGTGTNTAASSTGVSGSISITSGAATGGITGNLTLGTGAKSGSQTNGTGAITIGSGASSSSATTATGAVTLQTGAKSGTGGSASGELLLRSGNSASTASNALSGNVTLQSGDNTGASTAGTGVVTIKSGLKTGGSAATGGVNISTGTSSANISGTLSLFTGTGVSTGNASLTTGNASAGNSGNVTLQTGTASGTRGKVNILATSLDMNTSKIVNLVDPTADQEAATKKYVDDTVAGVVDVFVRATSNNGATVNATTSTIVFEDEESDSTGSYDNTTGVFTAPSTGKYAVLCGIGVTATLSVTQRVELTLLLNGSTTIGTMTMFGTGAATTNRVQLCQIVNLSTNDTLEMQGFNSTAGGSLVSSTDGNWLTIIKVRN